MGGGGGGGGLAGIYICAKTVHICAHTGFFLFMGSRTSQPTPQRPFRSVPALAIKVTSYGEVGIWVLQKFNSFHAPGILSPTSIAHSDNRVFTNFAT